ncbi:MAG: FMN-binding protein [Planctomycetes bacterium]|nr:FMN-binding protein [Planctomycetota bacterium]
MISFIRYPLVLGVVAALSGLALYGTYSSTKAGIAKQEALARSKALEKIFLSGYGEIEEVLGEKGALLYTKVWLGQKNGEPDFYAIEGSAIGYNSAVPVRLMAGFTNPQKPNSEYGNKAGYLLVGWSVTRSEETPGLGENIKEVAPACSIAEVITSNVHEQGADKRTGFQKQFADPATGKVYTATELKLSKDGGPIDGISGATITSRAVIGALQDADAKLKAVLENN